MSSVRKDPLGSRLALLSLLALLAMVAMVASTVVADHPVDQDANSGGTGLTEWTGNWDVGSGDDLTYANQTISLNGRLLVANGGRLVLRNVTLVLFGTELSPQEVRVQDGELVLTDLDGDGNTEGDRSVIKANDTEYKYFFAAESDATLELSNSLIRDCGRWFNENGFQAGVYIATDDAVVESMEIAYGHGGLFLDGAVLNITGCNVHHNEWIGVYVDNNADVTLEDCDIMDNDREGMMVKAASNLRLVDTSVRGNNKGIVVDGSHIEAHDSTISGNDDRDIEMPYYGQGDLFNCTVSVSSTQKPIRLDNSSLASTNGNFDLDKVQLVTSKFLYKQWLTVEVTWGDNPYWTPIPDVDVEIKDIEDRLSFAKTGPDGKVTRSMEVKLYDWSTPIHMDRVYDPFLVKVTHNALEKDKLVTMRTEAGEAVFRYADLEDPTAVAPSLDEVDLGVVTQLDGSDCSDNVAILSWNWSFDEFGQVVYLEGEKVNHTFKEAKTYSIKLRVTDTTGNTGAESLVTFFVTARDRIPPTTDAGPDRTVDQETVVTLDGSNSTDNVGIAEYTWSFTYDGAPRSLTGRVVTWQFDTPGVYLVVLTVVDAADLSDSDTTTITVLDTSAPTTAVEYNPEMPPDRKYDEIVQIVFTVTDKGSTSPELNYRINSGEWEKVVGGIALSFGGDLQYGDGTYAIDYYALDSSGNTEEIQSVGQFLVDAITPTFEDMDPPITPYTTTDETYTIKGRTEVGATLTINNEPVTVGEDGTFSHTVILEVGTNPFHLYAVDPVDHVADLSIDIERTEYKPGTGDDGSNAMVYIGVGAAIVIVVLLLLVYMFVLNRPEQGEEPPME